jgi:hypothetical protein
MPCEGQGTLTVVFLAGGGDPTSIWDGVVTALGPDVLTCRFDRPGRAHLKTSIMAAAVESFAGEGNVGRFQFFSTVASNE